MLPVFDEMGNIFLSDVLGKLQLRRIIPVDLQLRATTVRFCTEMGGALWQLIIAIREHEGLGP